MSAAIAFVINNDKAIAAFTRTFSLAKIALLLQD
jgi:hypothetical protein